MIASLWLKRSNPTRNPPTIIRKDEYKDCRVFGLRSEPFAYCRGIRAKETAHHCRYPWPGLGFVLACCQEWSRTGGKRFWVRSGVPSTGKVRHGGNGTVDRCRGGLEAGRSRRVDP